MSEPNRAAGDMLAAMKIASSSAWLVTGIAGAVAWGLAALWHPANGIEHTLCLFWRITSIPCPGCGMTRAFAYLARGDLATAWRMHPLAPLLAAELLAGWVVWGVVALTGRPRPVLAWTRWLALAHLPALVAVWLLRMVTGTLPP